MKKILNKDSLLWGAAFSLGSEVLCALLLWVVLLLTGTAVEAHVRWFAACFVPPLLLIRYYAHAKDYPNTLKASIVTFFVTFVAFMWFLLKYHHLNLS